MSKENGSTSLDPVLSWYLCWHSHQKHEVSRVTCCHQHTLSNRCFVDWTFIEVTFGELFWFARLEPHWWAFYKQNFGITFFKAALIVIPFASFNKHAGNIDSVIWSNLKLIHICDDMEII